jgi:copper homeostasis protein
MEGSSMIAHLVKKAQNRITIMPGTGITETNVADLTFFTGATEIHASARTRIQSKMTYKNDHIVMGDNYGDEYVCDVTDAERVRNIIKLANK